MRTLRVIFIVLALGAVPLRAADQPDVLNQAVDRIVAHSEDDIIALSGTTGSAIFSTVPMTNLAGTPQAVVSATSDPSRQR